MIRIIEKNQMLKTALEKTCETMNMVEGILVNINRVGIEVNAGDIQERPLIFYSFSSELSVQMSFHYNFPFFYMKDAGFIKMPFRKEALRDLYDLIVSGKKIENQAMILASGVAQEQSLAGVLLHDKQHCEEKDFLKRAEIEFEFTGDVESVVSRLASIKEGIGVRGSIKKCVEDNVISGVFCDIDGTILWPGKEINIDVVDRLKNYEKTKAITLWTGGGDLDEKRKILFKKGIKYPITEKYLFKECRVEIVLDDAGREEFEKDYKIFAEEYIKIPKCWEYD